MNPETLEAQTPETGHTTIATRLVPAPVRRVAARTVAVHRPPWWTEAIVVLWLALVYDMLNNMAPQRVDQAVAHGVDVLHLERSLHLDPELTLNQWTTAYHWVGAVLANYYDIAHFVVTFGLLAWLYWKRADLYRPLRNILIWLNIIGFIVYWLYPVAPPRLLPGGMFNDTVISTGAMGSFHVGPLATKANQFAAMPSLHIAWATWCALAVWRVWPNAWIRALGIAYPVTTGIAVMATANHYLIDVVAGFMTFVVSYIIAERIRPWRAGGWALTRTGLRAPPRQAYAGEPAAGP